MNILRGLPWVAIVLSSASVATGQATVSEEPGGGSPRENSTAIVQAARDHRSISLSGESRGGVAGMVPEFHTVERGDTLWDITGYYYGNPWQWPSVWGLNPQITNPHWIFPNDQVRLLTPQAGVRAAPRQAQSLSSNRPNLAPRAAPGTQYFFDEGWLERAESDVAGTIVGSPEDQMLLADGDQAYVEFPRRTPRIGEQFTIYQEGQHATGGDRNVGRVVRVLGTAVVESWNGDRHVATVRVTESLDSIERGDRMAAISRRLEVVPPTTNTTDARATIVATTHPRTLVAQQMVVFIDRGADDGVRPGNRFFILRRGDAWRQSLTIDESAANQTGIDRDGDGVVDAPRRPHVPDRSLPEEVVGEIIVVETRTRSCTGIVTHSRVEVEVGDILSMRRGY